MKMNNSLRKRLVFCIVVALVSSVSGSGVPINPGNNVAYLKFLKAKLAQQKAEELRQEIAQKEQQRREISRKTFQPAKKMLLDHNVPFDPEILLQDGWR